MVDEEMGEYFGTATSKDADIFVTGHIYDVYERGADHADECPCVNYQLPA